MPETKRKKLTRSDIVRRVSEKNRAYTKLHVKELVNAALDALAEAIATGNQVEIRRLGVFSTRQLPARRSRNPKTGDMIIARPFKGVKFRMSSEIKDKLKELED